MFRFSIRFDYLRAFAVQTSKNGYDNCILFFEKRASPVNLVIIPVRFAKRKIVFSYDSRKTERFFFPPERTRLTRNRIYHWYTSTVNADPNETVHREIFEIYDKRTENGICRRELPKDINNPCRKVFRRFS